MKNPRKKQLPGWFVTQLVFHLWRYGRHGQGTRNFSKPGSMANSNMLWCRQNIEWNHLAPLGYWSKGYSWSNKWWFKNILANSKTCCFIQTNSVSYQNILTTNKQSWKQLFFTSFQALCCLTLGSRFSTASPSSWRMSSLMTPGLGEDGGIPKRALDGFVHGNPSYK